MEELSAADYGNGQTEILDIDRLGTLHVILPTGQDAARFVEGLQLQLRRLGSPDPRPRRIEANQFGGSIKAYGQALTSLFSDYAAPLASGRPGQIFSAAAY